MIRIFFLLCILAFAMDMTTIPSDSQGSELKDLKGQIVYSSNRSGSWNIWRINADGSDQKLLTQGTGDESDVDPCFSPDGKFVLFSSTRGGTVGIWMMSTDGTHLQRICDGDQAEWSPDGKKIAYRHHEKIYVRNLADKEEKQISPNDWPHCSGPSWSPDGKSNAFACRWDAGNGIFLVSVAGRQPTKVYDQKGACEPHWSPDGKLLVYETETHICTIQPDGIKNHLITYYGGIQRYGRFSPDGKHIIYCQGMTETGPWELYIVPATGGTPMRLTEGGSDMNPDWK